MRLGFIKSLITAFIFMHCCTSHAIADPSQKERFLEVVKAVSSSEHINDPEEVGRLLGVKFELRKDLSDYCKYYIGNSSANRVNDISFYETSGNDLFSASGQKNDRQIMVGYMVHKDRNCAGQHVEDFKRRTSISFYNLSSVCVTQADVRVVFPQAKVDQMTDFAMGQSFKNKITEQNGIRVGFVGQFGKDCYDQLDIEQDRRYGNKAERVNKLQNACIAKRREKNAPIESDYDCCGTWDSLMDKEETIISKLLDYMQYGLP